MDFSEIDSGRLWFGQCVEGWVIYRRIDRGAQGDWEPAAMSDPDTTLYAECEHLHCDGPSDARHWPSKPQTRAAKVAPHVDAINAQLERVARTRLPGIRTGGRPLWACSETVADGKLVKIHDARGRRREQRAELSKHARRVRDERDESRSLPEQSYDDLVTRAMAQEDPAARSYYLRTASSRRGKTICVAFGIRPGSGAMLVR